MRSRPPSEGSTSAVPQANTRRLIDSTNGWPVIESSCGAVPAQQLRPNRHPESIELKCYDCGLTEVFMKSVQVYDTTLRDGAQGEGVNFSLQDKLLIARRLDECGFDFVEGGYPLSNPKDAEFFQRMAEQPLK